MREQVRRPSAASPAAARPGIPPFAISRRRLLASAAGSLAAALLGEAGLAAVAKLRRVGLIGAGWYGKSVNAGRKVQRAAG
jgi:hypothetical protein